MFTVSQSEVNKIKKKTLKDFGLDNIGKKRKGSGMKYKKLGYMK